jgi:hypothetical protein
MRRRDFEHYLTNYPESMPILDVLEGFEDEGEDMLKFVKDLFLPASGERPKPLNESKGTFVPSPNAQLPPSAFVGKIITEGGYNKGGINDCPCPALRPPPPPPQKRTA